jgi:hypothetical protein
MSYNYTMGLSIFGQKSTERDLIERDLSKEEIELLSFVLVTGVSRQISQGKRERVRQLITLHRDLLRQTQRTTSYPSLNPARNTHPITFDHSGQQLASEALGSLLDQTHSPVGLGLIANAVSVKMQVAGMVVQLGAQYNGDNLGEDLEGLQTKLEFNESTPPPPVNE